MFDLIIVGGAPGSGKSTICRLLKNIYGSPYLDFCWLREWHLKPRWVNKSEMEEDMSFHNLVYILSNYLKNGYRNLIVCDLTEKRILELAELSAGFNVLIATLVVNDDEELKKRIICRKSGYDNWLAATEWNRRLINRPSFRNEVKIDNTTTDPAIACEKIRQLIEA